MGLTHNVSRAMSSARDAVESVSAALDACLPQMHAALTQRKNAMGVSRLDVHTSQAELELVVRQVQPAYEAAHTACVNARTDKEKPGVWDELLGTCVYTKMQAYVRAYDQSVEDAFDRLDMALCLARQRTST